MFSKAVKFVPSSKAFMTKRDIRLAYHVYIDPQLKIPAMSSIYDGGTGPRFVHDKTVHEICHELGFNYFSAKDSGLHPYLFLKQSACGRLQGILGSLGVYTDADPVVEIPGCLSDYPSQARKRPIVGKLFDQVLARWRDAEQDFLDKSRAVPVKPFSVNAPKAKAFTPK